MYPALPGSESKQKKQRLDRQALISQPAAHEPCMLTAELLTLAVAAVKWSPEQGRLEEQKCRLN